jgi:hypothetical protein
MDIENQQQITLSLEVVPEDSQDADVALVSTVGLYTTEALRNDGYVVEPTYTGQRGGFLVDVIIPFLTMVWAQKEVILADISALAGIFSAAVAVVQRLRKAYERYVGKDAAQQAPIKITLEIDNVSISVETPDLQRAEAALTLAQHFQSQYPRVAAKVTHQSHIKVKGSIPKRPHRPRR